MLKSFFFLTYKVWIVRYTHIVSKPSSREVTNSTHPENDTTVRSKL